MFGHMAENDTPHVAQNEAGDPYADLIADLAELEEAPRYRPGPPCYVSVILGQLADQSIKARDTFTAMIDNDTISATSIAAKLSKHGFNISGQTISRHRRRGQHNGCRCPR